VLFQGTPEAARSLGARLEQAGLHSFIEGYESPYMSESGHQEVTACVFVPPDERQKAANVLLEWQALQPERVSALTRRLARVTVLSLLPAALWLGAWLAVPQAVPKPGAGWLAVLVFASLIVFGQLESRRHERERVPPAA
jgi:hypothetical protein